MMNCRTEPKNIDEEVEKRNNDEDAKKNKTARNEDRAKIASPG